MKIVIIDNFDSFTNNITHYLKVIDGVSDVCVLKNNDTSRAAQIALDDADAIVLSPGPGNVKQPEDLGICAQILNDDQRPILGVCLGQQAIAHFAGAEVNFAKQPIHGREWLIKHSGEGLFSGVTNPLKVVRYHSWIVDAKMPTGMNVTAWAGDEIMAIESTTLPRWGVQFHPESIGTKNGLRIFENFVALAAVHQSTHAQHAEIRARRVFRYHELPMQIELVALVEMLRVKGKLPVLLESAMVKDGFARFSYVGADFGSQYETITYIQKTKAIRVITDGQTVRSFQTNLSEFLSSNVAHIEHSRPHPDFDFLGGLIGWFGYELQEEFVGVRSAPRQGHDAAFVRVNSYYVFDHANDKIYVAVNLPTAEASFAEDILQAMANVAKDAIGVAELELKPSSETVVFRPRHCDATYLDLIKRCQADIGMGESYELCLTNQITATVPGLDPWSLYKVLRLRNPCPYAAYLEIAGTTVVSSSPERFLSVDRDGHVEAKPIKGTIRRGKSSEEDEHLRLELENSEKDRAENLMIVDLLRHDLSEVCRPGTVFVPHLMSIETFPKVHQMVSTVSGQLSDGRLGIEAFTASFPGGSMTGAPKYRSMEILRDLENGPRGVYSGSIGWIGYDGALDQSIVIRTVIFEGEKLSIGCGGAITYLSDPESELDEIKLKARALLNCVAEIATGYADNFVLLGSEADDIDSDVSAPVRAKVM